MTWESRTMPETRVVVDRPHRQRPWSRWQTTVVALLLLAWVPGIPLLALLLHWRF